MGAPLLSQRTETRAGWRHVRSKPQASKSATDLTPRRTPARTRRMVAWGVLLAAVLPFV